MDNKYIKLIQNSGIFLIGNIGSQGVRFLFLLICTYLLIPDEFGIVEVVYQTATLILPIVSIGIVDAVFRYSMDKDENPTIVLTNGFAVIFIGSVVLLLLSPIFKLVEVFDNLITYLLALIIVQMIQATTKQFTRGIGKVKVFVISDFINSVSTLLFGIMFISYFHWGIQGYLLSYILAYGFDSVFLIFGAKLYIYIDIRKISLLQMKKMSKYSLPLAPNSIMWWLTETSNRYFILYILGPSMTGIYAVASKIPGLITLFTSVFFKAWQMAAVEEYLSEDKSQFYSKIFEVFWIGMVLSASLIFIILHWFMVILVSHEFYEAWRYIPLLILGSLFSSFQAFIGTNYMASKNTNGALKTSACAAVTTVLLSSILIPLVGLYGAAIATLVSYISVFIIRYFDTAKYVEINIDWYKFTLSFVILAIQVLLLMCYFEISHITGVFCFLVIIFINKNTLIAIKRIVHEKWRKGGIATKL